MRRIVLAALKILPLSTVLAFGACGVTDLQMKDFVYSTGVQVFSQGVTDYLGSLILANAGAG